MNKPKLRKQTVRLLTWIAVVALCAVVALAQDKASAPTDSQIEMNVVQALDAAPQLKNDLITAATIQGEVTLSGTVATADSQRLAESIVAKVSGVGKVHNNLKVGDPQAAADQQNMQVSSSDQLPAGDQPYDAQQPQTDQQATPSQQQDYAQQTSDQQGQYPQQGQGQNGQPYPSAQQSYPQYGQRSQRPAFRPAPGPLTIPAGTLLALRTSEPVASKQAKEGQPIQFVLISDINSGGYIAIPRGATVHGIITEVKNTERGELSGSAALSLRLTSLDLGGQSYPIASDEFRVKGPGKGGRTISNAFGGALLGAIVGGAAGGGTGAAIGAGVGAGAGTAATAATKGPGVWIPAEARVDFHLATPITVSPVSEQEALRLTQGLYPGGPTLHQRAPVYYGQPVVYGYPYGYPPVYYQPYYVVGGYHTWR